MMSPARKGRNASPVNGGAAASRCQRAITTWWRILPATAFGFIAKGFMGVRPPHHAGFCMDCSREEIHGEGAAPPFRSFLRKRGPGTAAQKIRAHTFGFAPAQERTGVDSPQRERFSANRV